VHRELLDRVVRWYGTTVCSCKVTDVRAALMDARQELEHHYAVKDNLIVVV